MTEFSDELAEGEFQDAILAHMSKQESDVKPPAPTRRRSDDNDRVREDDPYAPVKFGEFGMYMRHKRRKLDIQNDAMRDRDVVQRPQIFAGLAIYLNGDTGEKGFLELRDLLVLHGGHYIPYLDKKSLVTHIVASNLTPSKRDEFKAYKVATPKWLVDSVQAGKLLDWRNYALLACDFDPSASGLAFDDVKARLGSSTGQKSLFSMGIAAAAPAKRQENDDKTETMQDLSDKGVELSKAVDQQISKEKQEKAAAFFKPRHQVQQRVDVDEPPDNKASSTTTTDSPKKSKFRYLQTSDPDAPPDAEIKHPYLPKADMSERTGALLRDPDWLSKHTAASEDFIETYFQQSRLHFLSTWKVELKNLVGELQGKEQRQPRRKKLTGGPEDGRTIFHVDMDCFFVSAGLISRPELRGKPVAVCHARNGEGLASTSEIASCSYEARAKGVRNGMSLGRARESCPDIITIPFEFDLYKSLASKFYDILLKHANFLQAVSVDEALLEVEPANEAGPDPAMSLAERIRDEIRDATGCEASIGISHNILLARLATRKAKPANAYHLLPEEVPAFLEPLPVDSLPGIGWSLQDKLENDLDIKTVGQLTKVPLGQLKSAIGQTLGAKFEAFARGIDPRELQVATTRQSVSAEVNYGIRLENDRQVENFVRRLAVEVASRLRDEGFKARALNLKVMKRHPKAPVETPKFLGHGWCETKNASSSISGPGKRATDDGVTMGETAWKLMQSLMIDPKELRGIGIQLSKLEKDGVPVDTVLEHGQTRLGFSKSKPSIKNSSKSEPKAAVASEVLKIPEPSIIIPEAPILAPKDSEQPRPERARKMPKATQVAPIFVPAGTDAAELTKLGIDLEWWDSVDLASRQQALKTARSHVEQRSAWRQQKGFPLAAMSKPFLDVPSGAKAKIETIEIPDSSSPLRLTDADLERLQIDPEQFHALTPSLQVELYQQRSKHFVGGTSHVKEVVKSGPTLPVVPIRVPKEPKFGPKNDRKSSLDDVRTLIEEWVDDAAKHGPAEDDVRHFHSYVKRLVAAHEFAMLSDLLDWFRYLIDDIVERKVCKKDKVEREWREAWDEAFAIANEGMLSAFGSPLVV